MESILGLFRKPKIAGPDPAALRAQAENSRRMQEEEARAAREAGARQRLISATQMRGGPITLFKRTGARGVTTTLGGV